MKARGALTPGVGVAEGVEGGADILGYGEGESRFGKDECQMREVKIVVLTPKISGGSTVGRGGNAQQTGLAKAKQTMDKRLYAGTEKWNFCNHCLSAMERRA